MSSIRPPVIGNNASKTAHPLLYYYFNGRGSLKNLVAESAHSTKAHCAAYVIVLAAPLGAPFHPVFLCAYYALEHQTTAPSDLFVVIILVLFRKQCIIKLKIAHLLALFLTG